MKKLTICVALAAFCFLPALQAGDSGCCPAKQAEGCPAKKGCCPSEAKACPAKKADKAKVDVKKDSSGKGAADLVKK